MLPPPRVLEYPYMTLKRLLLIVLSWRLLVILAAIPAIFILPIKPGFTQLKPGLSIMNFILMWVSFDGVHYFNLAHYGYASFYTGFLQAFFPVFPLLIAAASKVFQSELTSGYLIVHLSLIGALWFLYKLVRLDYSKQIAANTILLLLIFPVSFFFGSFYSESFFLLVSVASFYFARKQNWFLACLLSGIASGTRVAGIFLVPAILLEFYSIHQSNLKSTITDKRILWFLLAPLGLLLYMNYLNMSVHDPFYFATIQPLFGAEREVGHIVLIHQVFYRYVRMLITVNHTDPLFFTVLLEFLSGVLFSLLTIVLFIKSRLSYAVYTALSFLLPTLTGTFSSMPRYVLVLFPGFILMSIWYTKQSKLIRSICCVVSCLLAIVSVSLFTRGYFIG